MIRKDNAVNISQDYAHVKYKFYKKFFDVVAIVEYKGEPRSGAPVAYVKFMAIPNDMISGGSAMHQYYARVVETECGGLGVTFDDAASEATSYNLRMFATVEILTQYLNKFFAFDIPAGEA